MCSMNVVLIVCYSTIMGFCAYDSDEIAKSPKQLVFGQFANDAISTYLFKFNTFVIQWDAMAQYKWNNGVYNFNFSIA